MAACLSEQCVWPHVCVAVPYAQVWGKGSKPQMHIKAAVARRCLFIR